MHSNTPAFFESNYSLINLSRPADVATGLEPFLHTFRTLSAGKFARVAIIDTGVDINLEEISSCVERGETFIDYKSDRESHWWVASEPHGTHMATIIRKLNPKCKLFIAKVGTSRDDIRIESLSRVSRLYYCREFDLLLTSTGD